MKKFLLVGIVTLASATIAQASGHNHNDIRGVIVGAGGGALLGQAIGRNTQSTVMGTAIGSVVGYLVGKEMDNTRYSRVVTHHREQPVRYQYHESTVDYNHPQNWRRPERGRDCREAEILGTIGGKARKMYGTVCRTGQGWELVSPHDDYYSDYRKKSKWHKPKVRKDRHYREYRRSTWVRH